MLFFSQQKGQGLVEYALIIGLVAIVVVGALALFGPEVGVLYSRVVDCVPPSPTC